MAERPDAARLLLVQRGDELQVVIVTWVRALHALLHVGTGCDRQQWMAPATPCPDHHNGVVTEWLSGPGAGRLKEGTAVVDQVQLCPAASSNSFAPFQDIATPSTLVISL